MKIFISIFLSFIMIFSSISINVFAYNEDVEMDMGGLEDNEDPVLPSLATVMVEDGKDAGYIVSDRDVHILLLLMHEMNF